MRRPWVRRPLRRGSATQAEDRRAIAFFFAGDLCAGAFIVRDFLAAGALDLLVAVLTARFCGGFSFADFLAGVFLPVAFVFIADFFRVADFVFPVGFSSASFPC